MPTHRTPAGLIRVQANALLALAQRLEDHRNTMESSFARAVDLLIEAADTRHRVILLGVGKSGHIAQKIAATLSSLGTPAQFLHAAEAVHGDLGIIAPGDLILALSSSGETEELLRLLPILKRRRNPIISLCGNLASTLAQASLITLDASVTEEACALNLAPTASTSVQLALGDALAIETSRRRNFRAEDFADLHPGGRIGHSLTRVRDLMHSGDALPAVLPQTPLPQVIYEMSRKKLGMTSVLSPDRTLRGIISDGDLRRLLERSAVQSTTLDFDNLGRQNNVLAHTADEIMNPRPLTIHAAALASVALTLMEDRKVTSLIVTDDANHAEGVLHIHDIYALWKLAPGAPGSGDGSHEDNQRLNINV